MSRQHRCFDHFRGSAGEACLPCSTHANWLEGRPFIIYIDRRRREGNHCGNMQEKEVDNVVLNAKMRITKEFRATWTC